MATLGIANPTLLDLAKTLDPDGNIADIVELLEATNEVLTDMSWIEGNLPTGHRTTMRAGLPQPTWRKLYQGVQPTKGTNVQVTDNTGMLEDYAEVDKALADLASNKAAFRLSEDAGHLEGMNQEIAQTLFYGNEGTEPEAFTGLSPRYNDLAAENADNIIPGGGVGTDNASIWLVTWGPNTAHGIVPKGSSAGFQMTDKGLVTIENADGAGGRMEAYRTHYRWDAGLSVRDWRYIVRIPNIDKSDLTPDAASGADLPELMFEAMGKLPTQTFGRPVFYMGRDIRTKLRQQLSNKVSGSTLTFADVGGRKAMMFQDIPIRRCDALSADEALVV